MGIFGEVITMTGWVFLNDELISAYLALARKLPEFIITLNLDIKHEP